MQIDQYEKRKKGNGPFSFMMMSFTDQNNWVIYVYMIYQCDLKELQWQEGIEMKQKEQDDDLKIYN